jgi:hypothetical protein
VTDRGFGHGVLVRRIHIIVSLRLESLESARPKVTILVQKVGTELVHENHHDERRFAARAASLDRWRRRWIRRARDKDQGANENHRASDRIGLELHPFCLVWERGTAPMTSDAQARDFFSVTA